MEHTYSIYDAKARLSELLRHVKRGRHITIAERGRPIARVVPYRACATVAERLAALEERGLLRRRVPGTLRPVRRVRGGLRRFLQDRE